MEECQKLLFQASNVSKKIITSKNRLCFGPPTLKIVLPSLQRVSFGNVQFEVLKKQHIAKNGNDSGYSLFLQLTKLTVK